MRRLHRVYPDRTNTSASAFPALSPVLATVEMLIRQKWLVMHTF